MNSRLLQANAALVRYPRFNELHQDIRLCQEMSRKASEPSCMALEGMTGAGKSTLVKTYAEAFTRHETPTHTQIPVFYLETPSPVTVKGMASRMLEVLGDPAAYKGALWSMNSRLIQYIKRCEVQLVILDDFHHLIDKDTNRITETVSDWLKVLIKETNIPYLVVGIEGKVERILQANSQLSRLFAVREMLRPFDWHPTRETTVREFASFIQYVEQAVGMRLSDEIKRVEMLERVHYATDGVVGNIMNLMRFAAMLAHNRHGNALSLGVLHEAYEKRMQKHVGKSNNPFHIEPILTRPLLQPADPPEGAGNRSRRHKEATLTANQVLNRR